MVKPKGEVEIKAISAQIGESETVLAAKVEGKEGEITFNSKYLLDVLNSLKTKSVTLEISGKLSPGVIKTDHGANYVYIIMPLRS